MPSKWIFSIASYARVCASAMVLPSAVTPSTRPPSVRIVLPSHFGAALEDFHIAHRVGVVDAGDRDAGRVFAGISLAGGDDAQRRPRVPFQLDLIELSSATASITSSRSLLQSHHQRLGFRIAEPAIEFQHLRPVGREHQAGIEHAADIRSLRESVHRPSGTRMSRSICCRISSVTIGVGEYAPMPPVIGPVSPSSTACDPGSSP